MTTDPIIILKAVFAIVGLLWAIAITGLTFANAHRLDVLEEAERARRLDEVVPVAADLTEQPWHPAMGTQQTYPQSALHDEFWRAANDDTRDHEARL